MGELTIKREKFCQKYIELGNASEAYRQSYNIRENTAQETTWNDAYKLLNKPEVAARISELRELGRKAHMVTVGTITEELEEARVIARHEKQSAPMISASMGKAKIHGLITDKQDAKMVVETKEPSAIEFARRAAFLFAQASKEIENGNQCADDGLQEQEKAD